MQVRGKLWRGMCEQWVREPRDFRGLWTQRGHTRARHHCPEPPLLLSPCTTPSLTFFSFSPSFSSVPLFQQRLGFVTTELHAPLWTVHSLHLRGVASLRGVLFAASFCLREAASGSFHIAGWTEEDKVRAFRVATDLKCNKRWRNACSHSVFQELVTRFLTSRPALRGSDLQWGADTQ